MLYLEPTEKPIVAIQVQGLSLRPLFLIACTDPFDHIEIKQSLVAPMSQGIESSAFGHAAIYRRIRELLS